MNKYSSIKSLLIIITLIVYSNIFAAGKIYFVIGSDTAIWDAMSTSKYNCTYNPDLYINRQGNTYAVMDPAFRNSLKDSDGNTMKLTWWMMAGNIFRYATNNNFPVNNIMTLYLMKKYHGDMIEHFGDEVTFHYHTFNWSDYNNDGIYYWNQAKSFLECYDDWQVTLAQLLLEEGVFPISFRSGWETMDNGWQKELNDFIPYSLHNKYPIKRTMEEEPLNNILDWSQAPSEFVPYNPSPDNYQVPGDSKGWNVKAVHLRTMINPDYMRDIFQKANNGLDQVVCVWGHLPEEDFVDNLAILNEVAHDMSTEYSEVQFKYCTAVEAFRFWRKSDDMKAPKMTVEQIESGSEIRFRIITDEEIFQKYPVVAIKDLYENYLLLECKQTGDNTWETINGVTKDDIAKASVAVCDTVGNQTIETINFLPDVEYIDDESENYTEVRGSFADYDESAWGTKSRARLLSESDTVIVNWQYNVDHTGYYNLFFQVPEIDDPVSEYSFKIISASATIDTIEFREPMNTYQWNYLSTVQLQENTELEIILEVYGDDQPGKILVVDAVKISPFVKERALEIKSDVIDLGEVSKNDTMPFGIDLSNMGYKELEISNITSEDGYIQFPSLTFPLVIDGMSNIIIPAEFCSSQTGTIADKIIIESNDQKDPTKEISVSSNVQEFFKIIDNEDAFRYSESGNWNYSVAQAYGGTSRYSSLNDVGSRAEFRITVAEAGTYEIAEVVPVTENASNNALYTITIGSVTTDSVYIDQNEGSGAWIPIGQYSIPANTTVMVSVINNGKHTGGAVLRADAIKIYAPQNVDAVEDDSNQPDDFKLFQNYPNPFNPTTTIEYKVPSNTSPLSGELAPIYRGAGGGLKTPIDRGDFVKVSLVIYDILGRELATLVNKRQQPGHYKVVWNAEDFPSGVYFYRISSNNGQFNGVRKMILLR